MLRTIILTILAAGTLEQDKPRHSAPPVAQQDQQAAFATLTAEYEAALAAWTVEVEAIFEAAGEDEVDYSALPELPYSAFWVRYRAFADQGVLEARIWCLEMVHVSDLPEEIRGDFARAEAISLAVALRSDSERSMQLAITLSSLSTMGMAHAANDALVFMTKMHSDEDVQRTAILCRLMALDAIANEDGDAEATAERASLVDYIIER